MEKPLADKNGKQTHALPERVPKPGAVKRKDALEMIKPDLVSEKIKYKAAKG